ncbi:hypothetical protein ABB37_00391 [Leptomonas pyrrhocoris]|uniref:SH3 domain-containing protein n=1 Tax=Leptomonas pyrrhocoris TaxID=157538 RepID=A0A0N1J5G1_LEPPY|nr:hypothetical protein ABB37_00391 [Leptomonas pyrrhocoris]XP_015664580.1 hypothetical protein ABB37_00391 [Leptomonas pyrrhocoris]KPA86140.1 hypothetical protein ABB37_00391 [Leptomonas pyrrhocoris]KPA86141.1 hypothetical protein ABB37_00391 [Leptomonas pyrrhocoris]|eukprot:XP_015664579.1 hypothetical protein ABB37_00391 [Leptomonas pyrrhocoris]
MSTKGPGVTHAEAERPVEQCIALIDYDALNADEISFRAGDVINVIGKGSASGFWEGYVAVPTIPAIATLETSSDNERDASASSAHAPHSLRGLFPNCLVTSNMRFKSTMVNYVFQNVALCLYTYQARGEGEMSFAPGDTITALRPSASPGWWYGTKSNGPTWTAPPVRAETTKTASPSLKSVQRFADPATGGNEHGSATSSAATSSASANPVELLFPTNFVTCDVVLIIFKFAGRQAHELSCKAGDVVQVHRRWNDGWWEGSLRERRGIFPSNYSVPNICTTSPPLFCARCRSVYSSNTFQSTCATCAAEEHVEDIMLQSLDAYTKGVMPVYNLFAGIDIGPLNEGDGVGGGKQGEADASKAAAADADRQSMGKLRTAVTSARSDRRSSAGIHAPLGAAPSLPRATLLTEKDLADLASNRVKLME